MYKRHTTACIGNNYGFRTQSSLMRFEERRQTPVNEYENPTAGVAHDLSVVSQAQEEFPLTVTEPHADMVLDNLEM